MMNEMRENNRLQKAEKAARENVEECRRQGVSMGRTLANWYCGQLEAEIDRLKAENVNLTTQLSDARDFMSKTEIELGKVCIDRIDLRLQLEEARSIITGLLTSADAMWEERNMGHDWPESCESARKFIRSLIPFEKTKNDDSHSPNQ